MSTHKTNQIKNCPKNCLICDSQISPFMSFGQQPIANGFLSKEQFSKEYFFEMTVGFCNECKMLQLLEQPEAHLMFNENYAFFSGTSQYMKRHFEELANKLKTRFLSERQNEKQNPLIVEIGCNDGILLRHFAGWGINHVGIEPSANVAEVARSVGVDAWNVFFNSETAKKIVEKKGKADVFVAANVMCHINNFNSVIEGLSLLMSDKGVVVFEDPYLGDVVEKTSYDQIYDEHVFLFSLASISNAFSRFGFEVFDVEHLGTHGGSMRYFISRKGSRSIEKAVSDLSDYEKKLGLTDAKTFDKFRMNCEKSREELVKILKNLKEKGQKVAAYAATSKSTTVINYCGITPDLIEYISDTTPLKQGKYSPGGHIPVLPPQKFKEEKPDYTLLFGWNHKDEIFEKEQEYRANGGKWIVYVPSVEVIS